MKRHTTAWGLVGVVALILGGRTAYRATRVDPATVTTAIPLVDRSPELCPGVARRSAQLAVGANDPHIEVFDDDVSTRRLWKVEKPRLPSVGPGAERIYRCRVSGRTELNFKVFVNEKIRRYPTAASDKEPFKLDVPGTGYIAVAARVALEDEAMSASWTCGNRRMVVSVGLEGRRDRIADVTALAKQTVKHLRCEETAQ